MNASALAGNKTALVLSGGGARAAYQVGVLKAIAEMLDSDCANPFPIICGTSAGAINAATIASHADCFSRGVAGLEQLWGTLRSEQVHRVGYTELMGSTLKLLLSFFRSGITFGRPLSLFDNMPLYHLLMENIQLQRLPKLIESGRLHALCITALGYQTGQSISFFQGDASVEPWRRARRIGVRTELTHKHLMASSALPALFPAVKINREYFGDGAMRQTAPMSAALHLGAKKLLVVGVSGNRKNGHADPRQLVTNSPSLAQIFAQLLNSAFIDAMEEDIDMMQRFNKFINEMDENKREQMRVRPVEVLVIEPSVRFDELASRHIQSLPKAMRIFLKTIGATQPGRGASIASYLLFEASYCQDLMQHGYADCMAQADKV
ncbi:MAG TPA: patatin-like phospholipase family protein, partial [Pseudomonadales bacterium]|nr:patatin-like phospholipase family protein [Pseudomonadales bacterium]